MSNGYEPPKWAGKPPSGYHLDVTKDGKLFTKLPIDEKSYYTFGRNLEQTDFCIDHQSCSRVHAALVYHKHLKLFYLTDLNSTHGSHIGNVRLEPNQPTPLQIDASFHFGASTRIYTLREKPKQVKSELLLEEDANASLPETEFELDKLTQNNTINNRTISMLGIDKDGEIIKPATAMKRKSVSFNEEEDVINPEDVDPTVGRFRNLVSSTIVIPNQPNNNFLTAKSLGIHLPSPAPEPTTAESTSIAVDEHHESSSSEAATLYDDEVMASLSEDKSPKKKYAKEAWPGMHSGTPLTNF
ncbi:PREDICTED: nuclear inhibitor of protein phosphatase 1-like [Rhagoletis zephyria]|uniref:nuclear inhibitor of protein phosphatase 1-like n=1 Tax=Rhagoletis zephyria TaxID=28612 RepID=UPI00081144E3|nr:PREDICTED: nuclear inhibitor of protein phosphatase 1-like [Rhagoletis zephyria]